MPERHERDDLALVDVERERMLTGDRGRHHLAAVVVGLDLEGGGPRRVGELRSLPTHRCRTSLLFWFSRWPRFEFPNSDPHFAARPRRSGLEFPRPKRRRARATSGRGPTARTGT